jgi:hypothetical protein
MLVLVVAGASIAIPSLQTQPRSDGGGPSTSAGPKIIVDPRTGTTRNAFIVQGTGWTPNEPVDIKIDANHNGATTSKSDGSFNFFVSSLYDGPVPVGTHTVIALINPNGNITYARATFAVRA